MKLFNKSVITVLLIMVLGSMAGMMAQAQSGDEFSMEPTTKNGEKWRIAYYEGGEYIDYQRVLLATIRGLMELGWIDQTNIPPQQGEQTKELWNWLATEATSSYLEFVPDAHYSAAWDENTRTTMAAQIIDRLNQQQDIDLIIAMGTWAGQDLANDKHSTPTMVLSVADPLASGIIQSIEDSGYDHVHTRVDPYRDERQVMIFYDIIGFQRLGIAYEDTVAGRSYAAIDKAESVAQEVGFEIVSCYTKSDVADISVAEESVKQCFHELGPQVDAIYVTTQGGINSRSIPELVEIVNSYRLPTFSQSGSEEVKYGFLLSISKAGYKYLGQFHAGVIAKVLNGALPRALEQIFEAPPKIAINLKTAEIIGYDPPVDVLGAADEIYQEIQPPE
ncbi:ABC transporter substrate-binding protein [candidate division KSB3 bacterium]|uniref:ABC transporter substrate-binding protein n=1 Tax=candidate division KSB3 bacterium TaxID=2044937 RepID=A0A9D5Q8D9_9BACT|nr:ABC transporter substrate-binding protein [candidate division KSB3 bacterium]MBD3326791.1 ABC transporter substrate-binding protein [candidate division KSB3 bacterium]